jgi:hypothetical protein
MSALLYSNRTQIMFFLLVESQLALMFVTKDAYIIYFSRGNCLSFQRLPLHSKSQHNYLAMVSAPQNHI